MMDAMVAASVILLELENAVTRSGIKFENGGWIRVRDLLRLRQFHGLRENDLMASVSSVKELELSEWNGSRWARRARYHATCSNGGSRWAHEIVMELENRRTQSGIMFETGGWVSLRNLARLRQLQGLQESDICFVEDATSQSLELVDWHGLRWVRLNWGSLHAIVEDSGAAKSLAQTRAKQSAMHVNPCASIVDITKPSRASVQQTLCGNRYWQRMVVGVTARQYAHFLEQAIFSLWRRCVLAKKRAVLLGKKIVQSLRRAGFQRCGMSIAHMEKGITIEPNVRDFKVPVHIVVDGIDAEDLRDWAEIQISEDPDNFGVRLIEWAAAQRSAYSGFILSDDIEDMSETGLEKLEEDRRVVIEEVAKRLVVTVATLETRLKARKPMLFRSWGRECSKSAPAGAEANFNACVLNAKGGEADASRMNGTYEEMQRKLIKGPLFLGWMVRAVLSIESSTVEHPCGLHNISINCAHGRHRSVSAAEVLRKWFYPQAEHVLQEKQRVSNAKGWSGKALR